MMFRHAAISGLMIVLSLSGCVPTFRARARVGLEVPGVTVQGNVQGRGNVAVASSSTGGSGGSTGSSSTGSSSTGSSSTGSSSTGGSGTGTGGSGSSTGSSSSSSSSTGSSSTGSSSSSSSSSTGSSSTGSSSTGGSGTGGSGSTGSSSGSTGSVSTGSSGSTGTGTGDSSSVAARFTGTGSTLRALTTEGVTIDGRIAAVGMIGRVAPDMRTSSADFANDSSFRASAELEHVSLPRSGGETSLVIRAQGAEASSRAVAPTGPVRIHLVIDASTSMRSRWLDLKDACVALLGRLRAEDELQIVAYAEDARVVFPLRSVGDGRAAIAAIRALQMGGGTNIEAGLGAAYAQANDRSLVVLFSDGAPNGGLSDPRDLGSLAADARARLSATTTVVGIGSDFDHEVLGRIAGDGGGIVRISPSADDLDELLADQLDARHSRAASDITIDVELGAHVAVAGDVATGITVEGRTLHVAWPQLGAGEARTLVIPIRVGASAAREEVAHVSAGYRPAGRAAVSAQASLSLDVSPRPVLRAGGAALVVLDHDLAIAMESAAESVKNGDGHQAAERLRAHVVRAETYLAVDANAALRTRTDVLVDLGSAIEALVPGASFSERRQVGLALSARALELRAH